MAAESLVRGVLRWAAYVVLLWAVVVRLGAAAESPSASPRQPVDYMIVVTGGEILAGAYADSHTLFLTRTLRPLGLRCVGSISLDDKREEIQEGLRFAAGRARLVIVTGGLGPTDNDVTRETLSEFTGIALEEQPDVLAEMERRFKVPRDQLRPNLRKQTRVPIRGAYLKNASGSAVGLVFDWDRAMIVALPGPPRELQPMARDELVPLLRRRFGTRLPGCSLTLRFVGVGQSQIDHTLKEHAPLPPDVTTFSTFEGSRVDFTFALPDDTPQDRARLEQLKRNILESLGDYVYAEGETTLEEHVASLLENRGTTLALAEVGSGGALEAALGGAERAPKVLAGACAAPTEEKLRRLLRVPDAKWSASTASAERAGLLASAAAEATGSPWAVAVGGVQQEPAGGRFLEIALRLPDGRLEHQRVNLRGSGDSARAALVTQLLDQLRRRLR